MFLLFVFHLNALKSIHLKYQTEMIKKVEQKYQIPSGLLYAIMQVESRGHPLAVYSRIKGKRQSVNLNTPEEAIQYVLLLQSLGVKQINVGCMQINLKCHKNDDLSLWFSPEYNIEYAGRFLMNLYRRMGSWKNAVAFYHSGSKSIYHERYLNNINRYFKGGDIWGI